MSQPVMAVAAKLRAAQQKAGFTNAEVARQMGLDVRTVARHRSGASRPYDHLAKYAELYGVDLTFFFEK